MPLLVRLGVFGAMPAYRLYTIRGEHIEEPSRVIHAEDDAEAIGKAKQLLDGADLELWQAERLIVTLRRRDKE